ncbi:helix-turn-helix domain-containing protein [Flavobacterium orientale]|uniref:Transcriptional regulator n=1 Tax=Flavobacterium orientale TaxID=1756020 RepID=A0A916Y264_9FLAO|nr:helix-turn-helix transcriptional regulator [Flavobacterium orientale]GGD27823.1 transcriptional regulator [Flavobacterium orientale]
MLNTHDFVQKLEILLDYYQLNASSFADKIGVQRSSLSHLLSGRNKPSLEFVLKVSESFPEVDLYWFLLNKGIFPKSTDAATIETVKQVNTEPEKESSSDLPKPLIPQNKGIASNNKEIEKIVMFYKDGSFKSYIPEN